MGALSYLLCALSAAGCTFMLTRAHLRSRAPLLKWSAACFGLLTVSNLLVIVDELSPPSVDLFVFRNGITLIGVGLMLWGLMGTRS